MPRLTRRDFLRGTGAAGAMLSLPWSIRQAMAIEPARVSGTIQDVQHVVVLMLENRSFDHYFGTLRGVRGFADRFPIPLESGKPVWSQSDGNREITPFHLDKTRMNAIKIDTTSHEYADTQAAWNQGKYGFWPKFKIDLLTGKATGHSMGYYTRAELPFQFALADAFTLCDNYHCSVLSGTDPNRIAFFSGSNFDPQQRAKGLNATPESSEPNNLRCWVAGQWPTPGYQYLGNGFDWPTIPDVLQDAGVSWRIYQNPNDNWTGAMHGCLAFNSFRNAKPGSAIYENGMSHWSLDDLARDVKAGTLPQVSWILPSQAQCEHAFGSSPASGADFVSQVLEALVANPEVWSRTALFITFDENDGFFDHVPPPAVPSINPDGSPAGTATLNLEGMYFAAPNHDPYPDPLRARLFGKPDASNIYLDPRDTSSGLVRPYGMGPRVPMYVVSPWSRGGWVSSQVFDHSSVGQFIERRFGVTIPAISPWHRAVSGDLTSAFDFAAANDSSFPKLPNTGMYLAVEAMQIALPHAVAPEVLPAFGQESGQRPSRPTPYELQVHGQIEGGWVALQFVNTGRQGAVFHVYDQRHLDRIPRRYTVEAGKTLTDKAWDTAGDAGDYDLMVYSSNGFVRTFVGNVAAAALTLEVGYDVSAAMLQATLRNTSDAPVAVSITANAYFAQGPWQLHAAPGQSASQSWPLAQSDNWYDFSVNAPGFERRFAGRLENGANLMSDPAMAT